jgi:hypothetical protein
MTDPPEASNASARKRSVIELGPGMILKRGSNPTVSAAP